MRELEVSKLKKRVKASGVSLRDISRKVNGYINRNASDTLVAIFFNSPARVNSEHGMFIMRTAEIMLDEHEKAEHRIDDRLEALKEEMSDAIERGNEIYEMNMSCRGKNVRKGNKNDGNTKGIGNGNQKCAV